MDPTSLLSELTTLRAVLACIVIIGRLLPAVTYRVRRRAHGTAGAPPSPDPAERGAAMAVDAAQVAGVALTVLEWLHHIGVV